jgi:hypothetical protein
MFYQAIFIGISLALTGCGVVNVYDVDTKFSNVVRAAPVANAKKTIYMRVRDVTGHASELATYLSNDLKHEGYTVVADPSLATFKLMVNIIKFGNGTEEDQITFIQAIDPKVAADLSKEKYSVKTVRHEKRMSKHYHHRVSNKDVFGNEEIVVERVSMPAFADRVAIVDVEILNPDSKSLRSRIMAGVNLRGGFLISTHPETEHQAWTRLIQRLSIAIASLF